jgi:hypothetical protein
VQYVQLRSDRLQPEIGHHLQRHPVADDRHVVEPSRQHEIRQQRMRTPTDCTATASNPHAFDQQRRAQPAPIPTPADQPNWLLRTSMGPSDPSDEITELSPGDAARRLGVSASIERRLATVQLPGQPLSATSA